MKTQATRKMNINFRKGIFSVIFSPNSVCQSNILLKFNFVLSYQNFHIKSLAINFPFIKDAEKFVHNVSFSALKQRKKSFFQYKGVESHKKSICYSYFHKIFKTKIFFFVLWILFHSKKEIKMKKEQI